MKFKPRIHIIYNKTLVNYIILRKATKLLSNSTDAEFLIYIIVRSYTCYTLKNVQFKALYTAKRCSN